MNPVTDWLRKAGYSTPSDDLYSDIEMWRHWYMADVKSFYNYKIFNGKRHISCKRKTLGMARQACQNWADLLLNEKVKINCNDSASQDFIVDVLDRNNFWVRGNRCIESAFWSGLVAIIPHPLGMSADAQSGRVISSKGIGLTYSVGQQIIPLAIENGECVECAFASEWQDGDKKYTCVQIFTRGESGRYICENHIFDSTSGFLEKSPGDTNGAFLGMPAIWDTGVSVPPWAFIRPNIENPKYPDSPFGPAVFAGAIDIIQGIDTVYDAYINEYTMGKTRIVTSVEATRIDKEGNPFFDENDVVFYAIPQGVTDQPYINSIQPAIRATEMQTGLNDNLSLFSSKCGFGERYYQYNGNNITTATEVISENSHMFRVLKKHEIVLDAALKRLCKLILMYGNIYLGKNLDQDQEIIIDFDDSIIEDTKSQNSEMRADVAAGILRPEIYLSKKYGVSEEEAKKMMPDEEAMAYA